MALGIKQRLLAYHIDRRDKAERLRDCTVAASGSAETIVSAEKAANFHAEAVEYLSSIGEGK